MKPLLPFLALCLLALPVEARQDTLFVDSQENIVKKRDKASGYLLLHEEKEGKTVTASFYTLQGQCTRTSEYSRFKKQAADRVLHGTTRYKFSGGGQDSLRVFYVRNRRSGGATFYYPDGKVMAQAQYKDGQLDGLLQQFYENGNLKRQEVYKDGVAQGGILLSPDSVQLDYKPFYEPPRYAGDHKDLMRIILTHTDFSHQLASYMMDNGVARVSAYIEIQVDARGRAVGLEVLRSDNPRLNERSFRKVLPALEGERFVPGTIDGRPCPAPMRPEKITNLLR